jgi:hypothetical protein
VIKLRVGQTRRLGNKLWFEETNFVKNETIELIYCQSFWKNRKNSI